MRFPPLVAVLLTGLLLAIVAPLRLAAQGLPARTLSFDARGTDSASGHPIVLHLVGKSMMAKGRQYAGTCSILANGGKAPASPLVGDWQFVQNSSPALAGASHPAIAGLGTRKGAKPLRAGQSPTSAGQAINFTIETLPDGRYQVLLMDTFNDDSLEFVYPAVAAGK